MRTLLRAMLLLGLAVSPGCMAAAPRGAPQLPPLPRNRPASGTSIVRARAWRTQRPADPKEYPEGTRHVEARIELGDLPFNHNEFHVPAGKDAKPRWDFSKIALPDGSTLIGDSLNWHTGNRGYSPWSFLGVSGRLPGHEKPGELLKPSICVAAAALEADGWAAAELVFDRPIDATRAMRFAVRLQRLAGDPWVYLQLQAEPAGGTAERVSLHGYPNTTHPIFYDLAHEWPRNAAFLLRERWVWAAGQDWNMHDGKRSHSTPVAADAPGGVFFYNRHNSETGGMMAVFLPEEVSGVDAAGTYGVGVSFGLRHPRLRLALREWYDMRGWEPVRDRFLGELPGRVKALRQMGFAWPIADLLGKDGVRVERLLGAGLGEAEAAALRSAYREYQAAASRLQALAARDSQERYAAERAAIVAADRVRAAMEPLTRQWLAKGGDFDSGRR